MTNRTSPLMAAAGLAVAGIAVAGCGAGSPPSHTPHPFPGIHVSGDQLEDGGGTPVVLHGVDMSGTEYACAQNHTDDPFAGQPEDDPRTFAAMHAWGVNAVRLPLNEDCWLGINGVRIGGRAYRAAVTKLVGDLRASGFYVILDLHWSAPGTQRALAQNPAPDVDHSPAFWASVAAGFKNDDNVIFDLFNEPYLSSTDPVAADPWTCLWNGCTLTAYATGGDPATVTGTWRAAGMDQLVATVRGAGARNLILIAGLDWANDLSGWLSGRPSDPNLAASWHAYPGGQCSAAACWDQVVAPLAQHAPVVVTETGDTADGPAAYLPTFLPWCDSHHIGYLAWTWNAWSQPANDLVTDMAAGSPTAGEGSYFRDHLLQISGGRHS